MKKTLKTIIEEEYFDWNLNSDWYYQEDISPLISVLAYNQKNFFEFSMLKDQKILDLGSGVGRFTNSLERSNFIISLDYSPKMLYYHQRVNSHPKKIPVLAKASYLPFQDKAFNIVLIDGVLHHLKVQKVFHQSLMEVRRVLKDDGVVCFFDRNGSFVSMSLLKLSLFIKYLTHFFSGAYSSSATRNEIAFGGKEDLIAIKRSGFKIEHRTFVSSFPFFISVVFTNCIGYFISRECSYKVQNKLVPLMQWFESHIYHKFLCVEQCGKLRKINKS